MKVGKYGCEIEEVGGIGAPSGNVILFSETSGLRFLMRVTDIMRINAVIEQHIPKGKTKEQYFEQLSKREKVQV